MVKINLGKKLDFGKPIDLGNDILEKSQNNAKLVEKVMLSGRTSSLLIEPIIIPKPVKKKFDLGKKIDLGKSLDFGKELCL